MSTQPASRISIDQLLKPAEVNKDSLRHLIQLAESNDWKLIDWERYGTPALERVIATLEGPAGGTGALIDKLIAIPNARPRVRDVFPKGIPVIDRVLVAVEVTPGGR